MNGFLAAALLACLALPARADIVDSGSLVIGQQGMIGGTMTVQGNAFSVGGSTFVVAEGSVTLGGQLNVSSEGVKWPDGTISTSGGKTHQATHTFISGTQTTTSASWVSITGSTLTLTMTGGRLLFGQTCPLDNTGAAACAAVGHLVNGSLAAGMNSTEGISAMCSGSSSGGPYTWISTTTYTGATSVSMVFKALSATARFSDVGLDNCEIWALEVE